MRFVLPALLAVVFAAAPVRADCSWTVMANVCPPDLQNASDTGTSYPSFWSWQYILRADQFTIYGDMTAYAYHCTTNLGVAATGNATYTVVRVLACCHPQEDIEADARNEFTARAEIDDDTFAQARGSQRIHAPKMGLDCHALGGVEATSAGHGDGTSGTLTIPLFPHGPTMIVYWSKGGAIEQAFQASDSKTGGRSPETFYCQTNEDLSMSVGWWSDSGLAKIKNSKSELKVYGTCDGCCRKVIKVIDVSVGY
jgi:hypothetical protein